MSEKVAMGEAGEVTIAFLSSAGERTILFRRTLDTGDGGKWHDVAIALDTVAGRRGELELDHRTLRGTAPAAGVYWTNPRVAPVPGRESPNIILVSVDTLRADHLGCYGYSRDTSPHIDRLAREGILFRQAIASASWTLPSHASMFTGLHPFRHGAVRFGSRNWEGSASDTPLSPELVTLAEMLWSAGYPTAGFTGGGFVSADFGFDQGFERYWSENEFGHLSEEFAANVDRALGWISEQGDRRFFLFLHTYNLHVPYAPPPPYNSFFDRGYEGLFKEVFTSKERESYVLGIHQLDADTIRHLEALYDGEIRHTDAILGTLVESLRRSPPPGDTCLILTSDHGEEFNEHGNILHRQPKLYEELIHVPLIVWCPSRYSGARVVDHPVSLVDVTPTLLDIAGVPIPNGLDGVSLEPVLLQREQRFPPATFSEVDRSLIGKAGTMRTVRTGREKLILSDADGTMLLFDLESDPRETRNLSRERVKNTSHMTKALRAFLDAAPVQPASLAEDGRIEPATVERLRALGY